MSFISLNTKVNITFDCWTSPNHRSVMEVTAHWIDDNWKLWDLEVAAVEIEGGHSGQNLEQRLFNVLEEFNFLSKVFCITSDNASTNGTIATCLEQRCIIPGFTRSDNMLGCVAHLINLIANAGIRLLGTFDHHLTQENIISMSTDVILEKVWSG